MKLYIGKRIRDMRYKSQLSQSELGKKLNVDARTISSWETDRTEPKMFQIQQLCKIFGCEEYELTGVSQSVENSYVDPNFAGVIEVYQELTDEQKLKALLYMIRLKNGKE